jgi:predicted SAM-dependent methyltransferase
MKIHVGSGKRDFGNDWIHVDKSDYPHIKHTDIINLPATENSVDIIYASHVFEYFDRQEAHEVLTKWKYYLKPGGIIRLAVPNFEMYAKLYNENVFTLDNCIGPMYGKWSVSDKETIYHRTTYDFESLKTVLENAGLKDIKYWDWKLVEHSHIDDYSQSYYPHMNKETGVLLSLNVECKK